MVWNAASPSHAKVYARWSWRLLCHTLRLASLPVWGVACPFMSLEAILALFTGSFASRLLLLSVWSNQDSTAASALLRPERVVVRGGSPGQLCLWCNDSLLEGTAGTVSLTWQDWVESLVTSFSSGLVNRCRSNLCTSHFWELSSASHPSVLVAWQCPGGQVLLQQLIPLAVLDASEPQITYSLCSEVGWEWRGVIYLFPYYFLVGCCPGNVLRNIEMLL